MYGSHAFLDTLFHKRYGLSRKSNRGTVEDKVVAKTLGVIDPFLGGQDGVIQIRQAEVHLERNVAGGAQRSKPYYQEENLSDSPKIWYHFVADVIPTSHAKAIFLVDSNLPLLNLLPTSCLYSLLYERPAAEKGLYDSGTTSRPLHSEIDLFRISARICIPALAPRRRSGTADQTCGPRHSKTETGLTAEQRRGL